MMRGSIFLSNPSSGIVSTQIMEIGKKAHDSFKENGKREE
jgi:hypothetical protein